MLVHEGTKDDAPVVIGQIAHIVARHPDGPRGKESFQGTDINSLENLVLLCPVHHTIIDQQPRTYTVEVLTQMKHQHEQYIKARLDLLNRYSTASSHNQIHFSAPTQALP
jgi:HNH endonuclease